MKRKEDCRSGRQPDSAEKRTPCNAEFSKNSNVLSTENQVLSDVSEEISEGHSSEEKEDGAIKGPSGKSILESSTEKKEQGPTAPALPEDTEVDIALYAARKITNRLTYCPELDMWKKYEDGIWIPATKAEPSAVFEGIREEMQEIRRKSPDDDSIKRAAAIHKRLSGHRSRENIRKIMESTKECITRLENFENGLNLLNFMNGTLEHDTRMFREHRPDDKLLFRIETQYLPEAKCPKFIKFLEQIFQGDNDLIKFVIAFIGSYLDPRLKVQFFLFLHGAGSNGKSILILIISAILKNYAVKIPVTALMTSKYGGDRAQNEMARLFRKRLVVASETEEGQRLSESTIKDLTGGDRLTARKLYCPTFEFDPTHKLMCYGNHKPRIIGKDPGIWRRVRLVPFYKKFEGAEKRKPEDLCEELMAEAPGIVNLLLKGLEEARKGVLEKTPEAIEKETSEYRQTSDPIAQFLDERTIKITRGKPIPSRDLFAAFQEWKRETNTMDFATHIAFTKHLKSLGYSHKEDRSKTTTFLGIKLV